MIHSTEEEHFHIRSYGIGELASCYNPHISVGAARRKLMAWIRKHSIAF